MRGQRVERRAERTAENQERLREGGRGEKGWGRRKERGWVRRRDSDPLRTPGELGARAGTGARAPAGHREAAAETRQPCRMSLRLFCVLLAAVSGAQGWGYCECGTRRPAGSGLEFKACRARPEPHCGWVVGVPSRPVRARSLARSLSSFPSSPPRSAMQLRSWRVRPGLGLGLGSEREPGIESALAGIWHQDPSRSWCLGLRVGDEGVTGDPGLG